MSDLGRNKLVLFFTLGMSVKRWYEAGLARRDSLLYERLYDRGWETYFVTYGNADDQQYLPAGSHIQVLTKPAGLTNSQYGWRIPFIHRDVLNTADVIKSHQVAGARFAVWAKLRLGKPYIARCGYLHSLFAAWEKRSRQERVVSRIEEFLAFRTADAVCVPSQAEVDYICRRYGVNPTKAHVCPNWIDTERFKPYPAVPKHPRRVCFVARFEAKKQPLLLLEALRGVEDIELLMIGGGPLKRQIEAKIREYGLSAIVLDRLPNEELPEYLNSSAIYVLPTMHEGGSPKTLLEAMACGLPVVSTNGFGVNEAFQHGVHGYKCAVDDVWAFKEAILALLADRVHRQTLGQQGRQHVIANYSIERAVERELSILSQFQNTNCA